MGSILLKYRYYELYFKELIGMLNREDQGMIELDRKNRNGSIKL